MFSDTKTQFLQTLCNLLEVDENTVHEVGNTLMNAFLNFGSRTPDNLECFENLQYSVGKDRDRSKKIAGFRLKSGEVFVSEILNYLEGIEIPEQIMVRFPKLSRAEWNAVLRMATMMFLAVERDLE
ncbi:MAG: hypothetical protein IAE83_00365 [Anaerolinea sp.]|nr:hypothetical protein [Anaerolinea sp.]